MANVRHNEEVENEQDLQNLVTGIIFRMNRPFKNEEIVDLVNHYLKGSIFYNNIEKIEMKVEDTLDLLQLRNGIACWRGIKYPKDPIKGDFSSEYYDALRKNPVQAI